MRRHRAAIRFLHAAIAAVVLVVASVAPVTPLSVVRAAVPGAVVPDVTLPETHWIHGFVTAGGGPVEGATVSACDVADACETAITAYNGAYYVYGVPDRAYVVKVLPPDGSDAIAAWYTPTGPVDTIAEATAVMVAGAGVGGIDLALEVGHRIAGTVLGVGVGALSGVQVTATAAVGSGSATTDGSGAFTVHGLADGTYRLTIKVPNALNHLGGPVVSGAIGSPGATPTAVVVAGGDVTGMSVLSATGRRLAGRLVSGSVGADVIAVSSTGERRVMPAAHGDWIFRGLHPGTYTVRFEERTVSPHDHIPPLGYWSGAATLTPDADAARSISLTGGDVLNVDATVPLGKSVVGALPGIGAYVRLCDSHDGCIVRLVSGSFTIRRVPAGTYTWEVLHSERLAGFIGVGGFPTDSAHALRIKVTTAMTDLGRAELPGGATIAGRVLVSACDCAAQRMPVSAMPVAEPGTPWATGTARTEGGDYTLRGLMPGAYTIRIGDPRRPLSGFFDADSPTGFTFDPAHATAVVVPGPEGHSYVPIEPVRVVDSRIKIGVLSKWVRNEWQTYQVAGVGLIPANAVAVTGNVTVVGQTSAGYVTVSPTPGVATSTLNFPMGETRANNFTLPLVNGSLMARGWFDTTHLVVDITGYFVPGDGEATYTPLGPVRVLDSRPATRIGVTGGFLADVPRTLTVAGTHGIPTDAVAVTGNLTVTGQTAAGYLAVTPTATAAPATSTLNFPKGDTRANGLTAPLDPSGKLSIVYKATPGASSHVVLDVTGYYRASPGGLLFHPITPGRVVDTRQDAIHSVLTGTFKSRTPRTAVVGGHFLIPPTAGAITGNLTVTGVSSGGYVSATTTPTATPSTSTLNVPKGDTRANGITVPVAGGDDVSFVYKSANGATTHLVLDVTGYFE